ncbi:MAG: CARDB domain-containing protein [Candidatus Woesearchaeota archaeon]
MRRFLIWVLSFLVLIQLVASPPPLPHSVSGTIYNSDGINQVSLGTKYILNDTTINSFVLGETNVPIPGMSGMYFETIDGSESDSLAILAWNSTYYGKMTYILVGDMENVDVSLGTLRPPEVKVVIVSPLNNTNVEINASFNLTANITSIGGSSSIGCNVTINFSNPFTVRLKNSDARHSLGNLPLASSVLTNWELVGSKGWSVNLTVAAKCSSDSQNFDNLNHYTVYNLVVNDDDPPIIQLFEPSNNSWARSSPTVFVYQVSDLSGIVNCSLFLDGKLNKTNFSVSDSIKQNFSIRPTQANHTWKVSCADNSSWHNLGTSLTWFMRVDTVAPNITLVAPPNDTARANNTVAFVYNVTDSNQVLNCSLVINSSFFSSSSSITKAVNSTITYTLRHGMYFWSINCTDAAGNIGHSLSRELNITDPDLEVSSLLLSNPKPVEDELVIINASISNIGDENATGIVVKFLEGDPGVEFSNSTINISRGKVAYVAASWHAKVGQNTIFVLVDPPIETNGSIMEIREDNNLANITVYVPMWQIFYGSLYGQLLLDTTGDSSLVRWSNITDFFGNVYVADSDSRVSWSSLSALSLNLSFQANLSDFQVLDNALNTSAFNDSINRSFLGRQGSPDRRTFTVFDLNITGVPVINSTNTSNFVTGILWDSSDLAIGHYNGTQDIVFVGNVQHAQGSHGIYDYEVRIPAYLRSLVNPNNLNTLTFYVEIT